LEKGKKNVIFEEGFSVSGEKEISQKKRKVRPSDEEIRKRAYPKSNMGWGNTARKPGGGGGH